MARSPWPVPWIPYRMTYLHFCLDPASPLHTPPNLRISEPANNTSSSKPSWLTPPEAGIWIEKAQGRHHWVHLILLQSCCEVGLNCPQGRYISQAGGGGEGDLYSLNLLCLPWHKHTPGHLRKSCDLRKDFLNVPLMQLVWERVRAMNLASCHSLLQRPYSHRKWRYIFNQSRLPQNKPVPPWTKQVFSSL